MILLEVENRGVQDALINHFEAAKEKGRFDKVTAEICDYDGCTYRLCNPEGNREQLQLSLSIAFYSQLEEHGANEKLKSVYGDYLVACGGGTDVTLLFTIDTLPEDHKKMANDASRLKRNCFAAVFEKYFEAQANGNQIKRAVIHYREGESIYVEAKSDRVTVIFSTTFKEEHDIIIGGVFLQEFREGRRASATAPQVLFSTKEPPTELKGTDAKSGDDVGYITFVLLPRHFTEKTCDKTIDLIHTFRNYLHYHIKCSKAYINSRMRTKTADFLKVLNRARPDSETKKRTGY
jgi:actin related protein 2/3 complex subunit 2